MVGESDQKDKNESRKILIALVSLILIAAIGAILLFPAFSEIVSAHLAPGLGLRDSAVLSFFITLVIMVIFAVASGDGLLGEIQFILAGFFVFFLIIWLLLAWIF
ncbi:MAG: hypothetical protein RKH07_16510 [Gammaproteobacteria bacterium]